MLWRFILSVGLYSHPPVQVVRVSGFSYTRTH